MSKQATEEVIKAASLIATASIYLFLLSVIIAPGPAFASGDPPHVFAASTDQQLIAASLDL